MIQVLVTRDRETESWSGWLAQVSDLVYEKIEQEELWSHTMSHHRLNKQGAHMLRSLHETGRSFIVGEASISERRVARAL